MTEPVVPRFKPGARVRVRVASPTGHYRTPTYIQGKLGQVQAVYGAYNNPEELAYGRDGLPKQPLYKVVFLQRDVWKDRYNGTSGDTISVDLYDHWLEIA